MSLFLPLSGGAWDKIGWDWKNCTGKKYHVNTGVDKSMGITAGNT
ncbi:hypothetical protein [Phocaeicola fibrisolvens]|nr:hypothetical protein [Phocaeicola fibrisolvens]